MKHPRPASLLLTLTALAAFTVTRIAAQDPAPAGTDEFEDPPTLDAATILRPEFQHGAHFTVRPEVPTYAGANEYTIDSDFILIFPLVFGTAMQSIAFAEKP